ncbi:MAG: auracyanin family protein [Saprospirales bacterium]|nr:auracyanin family protein [Saprospirales bacterium]
MLHKLLFLMFAGVLSGPIFAQTPTPAGPLPLERDYYKIVTLPVPEGIELEIGGLTALPNGDLAAATRRGDVWLIGNPYMENNTPPRFARFAKGLHESLGLAYVDGALYTAQRGELTRLRDTNGDGRADAYETVYSLPLSGHYHEYTFGPKVAPDGSMFITGNVAFGNREWWRGESRVPWRGWTLRVWPDGRMEPWATGMRSPCGIGMVNSAFFYADNQGDWMGSGGIVHVEKGDFTGHPAGLRWADLPESPVQVRMNDIYYRANPRFSPPGKAIKPENIPDEKPLPLYAVAEVVPGVKLPAVWLPHSILGISTSEIIHDTTNSAFGPFTGQLFVGDQGQSKIVRVFLEKVRGVWQGAAFSFREGFQSGVLRMCWGKDGSMFVGQTNRGWGSAGQAPWGLQRLVWTGKIPFEMKAVRAMPDGFELEFTQPVDKASAANPDNYQITGFIYKYHPVYGSPVVNEKTHLVHAAAVSADGLTVRLVADSLREYYIHEIKAEGVRSYRDHYPLLHPVAYYTLNRIPDGDKLDVPRRKIAPASAGQHALHAAPKPAATPGKPAGALAAGKRVTQKPAGWSAVDQTVTIGTLPGLKYNRTFVTIKTGSRIKWTLSNTDDMPHNLVIVKPGAADAVGAAGASLGLKGPEMWYVPKSPDVLFHTKLTQPGASDSIYFVAPAPGDYTFVCTVPGHAQAMRGLLRITP